MLANRRAARLEEIAEHGKPVSFRRAIHKSKKAYDRKRFTPHITLIRQPTYSRDPELGTVPVPRAATNVERVSLMLSTRGKHGVIYTELGAVEAREAAP